MKAYTFLVGALLLVLISSSFGAGSHTFFRGTAKQNYEVDENVARFIHENSGRYSRVYYETEEGMIRVKTEDLSFDELMKALALRQNQDTVYKDAKRGYENYLRFTSLKRATSTYKPVERGQIKLISETERIGKELRPRPGPKLITDKQFEEIMIECTSFYDSEFRKNRKLKDMGLTLEELKIKLSEPTTVARSDCVKRVLK